MNDIHQKLYNEYAVELAKWQIHTYQGRNQRKIDAIQRYFNSTPARNIFARMMFLAYQDDNLVYTKSAIARELFITRQAASQMVDDCIAEGWVEASGNGYKATQVIADRWMDYVDFHFSTIQKIPLTEMYLTLQAYQQAMQKKASSDFTLKRVVS